MITLRRGAPANGRAGAQAPPTAALLANQEPGTAHPLRGGWRAGPSVSGCHWAEWGLFLGLYISPARLSRSLSLSSSLTETRKWSRRRVGSWCPECEASPQSGITHMHCFIHAQLGAAGQEVSSGSPACRDAQVLGSHRGPEMHEVCSQAACDKAHALISC